MSRLSEDRISHLAHVALDAIRSGAEIRDERLALLAAKKALLETLRKDDRLDGRVRSRIPKRVPEGSREWDILYRKYLEEERRKAH